MGAALAFSGNLVLSTLLIGRTVEEQRPPGGPIVQSAWSPTDVLYVRGEATALAFATGRVREGLEIAGSLLESIDGAPPSLTLMQIIFGATLGAIAGTVDVQLFKDEATISLGERRAHITMELADYPLVERLRLTDLIVPAAFASPSFLDEIHGLQIGDFPHDPRLNLASVFTRLSPLNRFAQGWKDARRIDTALLAPRLTEYERYLDALRADEKAWGMMEFRAPLIDWPLLAMLVGLHRTLETAPEEDLVLGPSTRFLQDLARMIVAGRSE